MPCARPPVPHPGPGTTSWATAPAQAPPVKGELAAAGYTRGEQQDPPASGGFPVSLEGQEREAGQFLPLTARRAKGEWPCRWADSWEPQPSTDGPSRALAASCHRRHWPWGTTGKRTQPLRVAYVGAPGLDFLGNFLPSNTRRATPSRVGPQGRGACQPPPDRGRLKAPCYPLHWGRPAPPPPTASLITLAC